MSRSSSEPLVSIVITTYNGAGFLGETISSLLRQSYSNYEILIIDDASTDNTVDICKSYNDERIKLFVNSKNLGISDSRNRGISLSRGMYIAMSDQDDLSLPARLLTEVDFLELNPHIGMVASAAFELKNGKRRNVYDGEMRSHILQWRLMLRCNIVHSSVCYRASILRKSNIAYRPEYRFAEDFVLFNELAQISKIVVLPQRLVVYREHASNASQLHRVEMRTKGEDFLLRQYQSVLGLNETAASTLRNLRAVMLGTETRLSDAELQQAGDLLESLLDAFEVRHDHLTTNEKNDIRNLAATEWWQGLMRIGRLNRNWRIVRHYSSRPKLSRFGPSTIRLAASFLLSTMKTPLTQVARRLYS